MEIRKVTFTNERALILGGGGASGNAWMIGIIAGLYDAGLDITKADLIIGTSAGATAAAQISSTIANQLLDDIFASAPQQRTTTVVSDRRPFDSTAATDHMQITGAIIAASSSASDMRRRMGTWALQKDATSDSYAQTKWRDTVASRLPSQFWPKRRVLITAVDAHSGEPVIFDRNSKVDLVDAVAASTAGGFAYSIGDNRYIDGGYRADVNADLAVGCGRVLIIAPLSNRTRKQIHWGLHLEAQVKELRANGSRVETIFPDNHSQNALGDGMNLLDLSTRQPSAQAGYNQGKVLAKQVNEFWR